MAAATTNVAAATDIDISQWTGVTRLAVLPPLKVAWQFEERTYTGRTGWVDKDERTVQTIQKGMDRCFDVIPYTLRGRTYDVDLRDMVQRVIKPLAPWLDRAIRRAFLPLTPEVGAEPAGRMKAKEAAEEPEATEMKEAAHHEAMSRLKAMS